MKLLPSLLAAGVLSTYAHAQTAPAKLPAFDVASVKANKSDDPPFANNQATGGFQRVSQLLPARVFIQAGCDGNDGCFSSLIDLHAPAFVQQPAT